jgi:hypothetical protein
MAMVVAVTPDVCLTPMGATPVPVPYPIVGFFNSVAAVTQSVRMCGRPVFTTASNVTNVIGDEAGTAGGVKSGVNKSICESVTASTTVKAEGNRILRHGDMMKMNNGNTIGMLIYMPGLGPVLVGAPSDDMVDTPFGRMKKNKGGTLNLLKDIGGELKDFGEGFLKSAEKQGMYYKRLVKGDFGGVAQDFFNETMHRNNPWNAIKPFVDAATSDDPDALGAKVITQVGLALLTDGAVEGLEGLSASQADAAALDAAATDAADTVEMDTAPEPTDTEPMDAVDPDDTVEMDAEPTEGTDGLRVTGAATTAGMDLLDVMLNQFSEATRALVRMSESLTEQLNQLLKDGWSVRRGPASGGFFADRVAKEIVIREGTAVSEVGEMGHEVGHGVGPEPPEISKNGLTEAEYVRQDVANRMADEGRAQFNAAKVRDEIVSNGGDDPGIPGQQQQQYQDIYDQYKNGNITQEEAEQQMASTMENETTSTTGDNYRDYYTGGAMDKYNQP